MRGKLEWLSEEEGSIVFYHQDKPFMTLQVFTVGEEEAELRIQDVVFSENSGESVEMQEEVILRTTHHV